MLDLHCHILPGIDDGPRDLDESLALARQMADEEVRGVAATPHCRDDHPGVVPGELHERVAALQAELDSRGIELTVMQAGEVDLSWALQASKEDLVSASYLGRGTDLLLETPYGSLPGTFEDLLFQLTLNGFRLLLAHPERNPTFQRDYDRLAELVRRGTLVQVTASSLARSARESRSAALAQRLVKDGLATVIASDTHGAAAPDRPGLRQGSEVALSLVGAERTRWMVWDAPRAILRGDELPPLPAADPAARKKPSLRERLRF